MVPTSVDANSDANVRVYDVLSANNDLFVTVINKEHGQGGRDVAVTLNPGKSYDRGEVMFLACESEDIAAKSGITLGGSPIEDDGSWQGKWTPLQSSSPGGPFSVNVTVPAASVAIVKLTTTDLGK